MKIDTNDMTSPFISILSTFTIIKKTYETLPNMEYTSMSWIFWILYTDMLIY